MNRKERLIERLKQERRRLEARRKNFEKFEEKLERVNVFTLKVRNKSMMYFYKASRLEDRIEVIDNKIRDLEREVGDIWAGWSDKLQDIIDSVFVGGEKNA